jgi:cold shock protein
LSTGSDTAQGLSWREFLGDASVASLSLVCMAVWLHAADSLVVATMLPRIVADISPEHGSKDVFLHISALERAGLSRLEDGQAVTYDVEQSRDGREAAINLALA